jgi:hypothetical protein
MWYVLDKGLVALCVFVFFVFPLFAVTRAIWQAFRPHEPTVWERFGRHGYIEQFNSWNGTGLIRDALGADHSFSVRGFVCPSDTIPTEGRFVTFIPQADGAVGSFRLDPARLSEVHISKKYAGKDNRALCLSCGRYMVPRPQYRYGIAVDSVCPFCLAGYKPPKFSA